MQVLSEDSVEVPVTKWADNHGFLTPKVKFAEKGWPDRLYISPYGHTIFIEFKRPSINEPDKLQQYRIRELKRRGIPAFCVNSVLEGINILKAALEPPSVPRKSDPPAAVTGISGAILGSRSGQDQHRPSSNKDPESEGPNYESPDRSSAPSDERSMAPGNRKVGRFPGDDVDNPPRSEEDRLSNIGGRYPPNQS